MESMIYHSDDIMGEELKAFITLKNPGNKIETDEIRNFCKQFLAPYKVPKFIEVIDDMPKTASGKILKGALKEKAKLSS